MAHLGVIVTGAEESRVKAAVTSGRTQADINIHEC